MALIDEVQAWLKKQEPFVPGEVVNVFAQDKKVIVVIEEVR